MKRIFNMVALGAVSAALLSGCIVVGNKGSAPQNVSLGQQLIDLKEARDSGAMTEAEFQAQRARLLEQHGH